MVGMKAAFIITLLMAALALSTRSEEPTLEVHEWGTLTVLGDSEGTPVAWYQAWNETAPLPGFVHRQPGVFKTAPAYVRMETPVLYFYPSQKMEVSAEVKMVGGRITEWFPDLAAPGFWPVNQEGPSLAWKGTLLPPSARPPLPLARATDPPAASHYFYARDVPEAWHFSATPPVAPFTVPASLQIPAAAERQLSQVEKFIFYRGSGNSPPPYRGAVNAQGLVRLTSLPATPGIKSAVALRVDARGLSWAALPALPSAKDSQSSEVTVSLDGPEVSRSVAALKQHLHGSLSVAGLTVAEATAMMATWESTWFQEKGTRILALPGQAWVNTLLPLTLTPTPKKLVRVFVLRLEIVAPETENKLLEQLTRVTETTTPGELKKAYQELGLGRFAQGALEIVKRHQGEKLDGAFAKFAAP